MKWSYDLIDWEWDVMRNGGNIQDAVKYSLSQGVKPLVWYNSSTNWIGPGPLFRLNKKADREVIWELPALKLTSSRVIVFLQ